MFIFGSYAPRSMRGTIINLSARYAEPDTSSATRPRREYPLNPCSPDLLVHGVGRLRGGRIWRLHLLQSPSPSICRDAKYVDAPCRTYTRQHLAGACNRKRGNARTADSANLLARRK